MIECQPSPERINVFIHRQDNPTVRFFELEKLGFRPCLEESKTHLIIEWIKSTYSDDVETLKQLKNAGVTKYSVSYPDKLFNLPEFKEIT